MHYAGTLLSLETVRGEIAGCLATKQMEKGLGDSYFPDD